MGGHGVRNVAHRSRRERHTGGRCLSACLSASATAASCRKTVAEKLVVLRNAVIRLRNLYRLRRSLQRLNPDLVFFACLDDMLPTLAPLWLFNLLLPYQWSGLLVQSALPPYHRGMPDTRPFLRSKNCVGVGILNEYSAKGLETFQRHILLFPDFADLSAPATNYRCCAN